MQKKYSKAQLSVLQIIDKLLTVLSCNELNSYGKARAASKEATEMCARLDQQMFQRSPEGVKWFGSREYREYLREEKARKYVS